MCFVLATTSTLASDDFLWKPLVNIPTETLRTAFLPSYFDFEKEIRTNQNLSVACKTDIERALVAAFQSRQTWAFKLFNSWAKLPPSGMLTGTMTDFGDYDQCLSIDQIEPQYCLLDFAIPMPQPMPKYHNYYQISEVLPSETDWSSGTVQKFTSNGTIYRYLADVSSIFYYLYLQIGICLPKSCPTSDIVNIAIRGNVVKFEIR